MPSNEERQAAWTLYTAMHALVEGAVVPLATYMDDNLRLPGEDKTFILIAHDLDDATEQLRATETVLGRNHSGLLQRVRDALAAYEVEAVQGGNVPELKKILHTLSLLCGATLALSITRPPG